MTYTPPKSVTLLGKETFSSGNPDKVCWYSRVVLGLECTVVWSEPRKSAAVEILYGDSEVNSSELPLVENAVKWANAKVRELLTDALVETDGRDAMKTISPDDIAKLKEAHRLMAEQVYVHGHPRNPDPLAQFADEYCDSGCCAKAEDLLEEVLVALGEREL